MSRGVASDERIYVNGVNATTGAYLEEPLTPEAVAEIALGQVRGGDQEQAKTLRARSERGEATWGTVLGVNADDLAQAGWGVIFAADADPAILEALLELLSHRRNRAGALYREYVGENGYRRQDTWTAFRVRHRVSSGLAKPSEMPYYLLIVGDPEAIPYSFQYQIGVERAVGRIHFATAAEYKSYAESVVAAEKRPAERPRRTAFFATSNPDDEATRLSSQELVAPLAGALSGEFDGQWEVEPIEPADASKSRLGELLGGAATPSLLFAATHGAGFNRDDPRQARHQGALITREWPGPLAWPQGLSPDEHYFSADDVAEDARLTGLVAFFFACYGAGTPRLSDFVHRREQDPRERLDVAEKSSLAPLAQRLLAHPRGGALAVVGHVDRAWSTSFRTPGVAGPAGRDVEPLKRVLKALMLGYRLGPALEELSRRHAQLSTELAEQLYPVQHQGISFTDDRRLAVARLWTANNDARNWIILGDPAVRPIAASRDGHRSVDSTVPAAVAVLSSATAPPERHGPEAADEAPRSDGFGIADRSPDAAAPAAAGRVAVAGAGEPVGAPDARPRCARASSSPGRDDPDVSFSPPPVVPPRFGAEHPDLYRAWVEHITAGYRNNDLVFQRIMNAFMRSHYSTLVMYWLLFVLGISFFVMAGMLALLRDSPVAGAVFGGLSVATFLTYFVGRSTQSVEENLQFVTWLGVIYNSYWTHQSWAFDPRTAQRELDRATEAAIAQLKELIAEQSRAAGARPGLRRGAGGGARGVPGDAAAGPRSPAVANDSNVGGGA